MRKRFPRTVPDCAACYCRGAGSCRRSSPTCHCSAAGGVCGTASVYGTASVCCTFSVCVRRSALAQRMGPWISLPRPLVGFCSTHSGRMFAAEGLLLSLSIPLFLHKFRYAFIIVRDPPHDHFDLCSK